MKLYNGEGQELFDTALVLDETSTDEQIPSAKAVYDYVNEVIGGIENGSY